MEAVNQGEESETGKRSAGGTHSGLVGTLALGALAAGGLAASAGMLFAERISPEAEWISARLEAGGLGAGVFLIAGVGAASLAVIAGLLTRMGRRWNEIGDSLGAVADMELSVAGLRTRVSRVHLEVAALQEANKTLVRLAQDQSAVQAAGMQIDATYRLAASMDQLGARIEDRIEHQNKDLSGLLENLRESVSAAQEQLDASQPDSVELSSNAADPECLDEALLPELPDASEELEVEVELEFGEGDDFDEAEEPRVDPSSFDWGNPPDASTEDFDFEESGLGLLDELDDEGAPLAELEDMPTLSPGLAGTEAAPGDPNLTGGQDPLRELLSEEHLQAALESARKRPID